MTIDVHTLTGPYALNALSDADRAAFEDHLARCDACREEVSEFQETVVRLGSGVAEPPPTTLKSAVIDQIRRVRQLPPELGANSRMRRRGWPRGLTSLAVAASLLGAVTLGAQVIRMGVELDDANEELSQLSTAQAGLVDVLTAADARMVIDSDGGTAAAVVVSNAKQQLAFVPNRMPEPAPDHTYQLWLITPKGTKSAGLLSDPARPIVTGTVPGAQQFAVTIEPAGGSEQPTTGAVMLLALP